MHLVISDLHFGDPRSIASHQLCLERLEPLVAAADGVILNGDVLALLHAPLAACVNAARPFGELLRARAQTVTLLPGNHEAGLWGWRSHPLAHDAGSSIFSDLFGEGLQFGKGILVSEDVSVLHGHQSEPFYHALIPDEATQHAMAVAYSCALLLRDEEHPWLTTLRSSVEDVIEARALTPRLNGLRSDADERAGAQATLTALRVALGPVIFGHTHQRLDGEEVGPWRLYNAGSWMYDPVQIACDGARSRPGAVAVIFNGQVRLLDLLSDLGGEELADMSTGAS